jgi:hypothetical protein
MRQYLQLVAFVFVIVGVAMFLSGAQSNGQSSDQPKPVPAVDTAKPDATTPTSPKFVTTAEEEKDLRIAQLSAQLAQSAFSQKSQTLPEFGQFQQSLGQLQAECARVIAKHKWPKEVQCDVQQIPVKFCEKLPCAVSTPAPAIAPVK